MTVNISREVLMHPDFKADFREMLCKYLNTLIDAEFEKDDPDFDFIDECADAINEIRENLSGAVFPIISKKEFFEKLGLKTSRTPKITIAVAAAVMMLFAANFVIASATDYNILNEIKESLIELFIKEKEETTTEKVSETTTEITKTTLTTEADTTQATTQPTTEKKAETTTVKTKTAEGIKVEFDDTFKTEYDVGESFDSGGLKVYLIYDDKSSTQIKENDYNVSISSDFGKTAGYETVTITHNGFKTEFKVRILNAKTTPLLTSIYATFQSGYDFTAEDIDNIDLSFMKVFAVYSDGSEKELNSDEYSVIKEDISTIFEKKVMITITHRTCISSFIVFEKQP